MKKIFFETISVFFALMVMLTTPLYTYASTSDTLKKNEVHKDEDRTGKTVTIYVKSDGSTVRVESQQGDNLQKKASDVLVSTFTLSAAQTAEIYENIKNIQQITTIIGILAAFIPNPFAGAFLTAANAGVLAEDIRWAALNGKRVRFEEYCRLPHTSYSHYFRYTIIN